MGENLTRKIIREHLVAGRLTPGEAIALGVDQTLAQDGAGAGCRRRAHRGRGARRAGLEPRAPAATVMYRGVRAVLVLSYARIHESNLVNFEIPPLRVEDPSAYEAIMQRDELEAVDLRAALERGEAVVVRNRTRDGEYRLRPALSSRQLEIPLVGGLSRQLRRRWTAAGSSPTPATGR